MKRKLLITVFMSIVGITLLAAGIAKWELGVCIQPEISLNTTEKFTDV